MTVIQFAFCFIYSFLITVQPQVINITSIVTAVALALLIVPGTCKYMKVLDCYLGTPRS